jgi:hypothetical protein
MDLILTEELETISSIDELAAKVYQDKKYYFYTYLEIAKIRNLPATQVKELFYKAKDILSHKHELWLEGLSNRAKKQLKIHGYMSRESLQKDLRDGHIDLEDKAGIGHKTATEIYNWYYGWSNQMP